MESSQNFKNAILEAVSEVKLSTLRSSAAGLFERYGENTGRAEKMTFDSNDALAYAVTRMPSTVAVLTRILGSLSAEIGRLGPVSLLDVGAGTGASLWACEDAELSVKAAFCLEKYTHMSDLGKRLAESLEDPILRGASWKNEDVINFESDESYGLVIASYMINELAGSNLEKSVKKLWGMTEGILLIVEPGSNSGYKNVMRARKQLLSMGAKLVAPCPHSAACPIEKNDFCAFECRVARSKLHKEVKGADVPYEDESYIYAAFSRAPATVCQERILRHPTLRKNSVLLKLCNREGQIEEREIFKSDKDNYKKFKKANAGDTVN